MLGYFTEGGKKGIEQASKFKLDKFYDPMCGTYVIPESEVNDEIRDRVFCLLKSGSCFKADGSVSTYHNLGLIFETHMSSEGVSVDGEYDWIVSEMEAV